MIVLTQHIIHLVEAHHDREVINGADPSKTKVDRAWHKWDTAQWLIVWVVFAATLAVSHQDARLLLYFFTAMNARQLMMSMFLNRLRGKPAEYLSDRGWDGFLKRSLGEYMTLTITTVISVVTIILDIYVVSTYLAAIL